MQRIYYSLMKKQLQRRNLTTQRNPNQAIARKVVAIKLSLATVVAAANLDIRRILAAL